MINNLLSLLLNARFRYPQWRRAWWFLTVTFSVGVLILVLFRPEEVITQTVGWEQNYQISGYKMVSKNVSVSSRGNFVASAFEAVTGNSKGIFVSVSFDGGAGFLPPIKVADIVSQADTNPQVAVSGKGDVSVAWHAFREEEFTDRMYFAESRDFGANWTEPKQIVIGYDLEMLPRVYYDEDQKLHLFFQGNTGDSFNLYHAIRNAEGTFEVTGPIIEISQPLLGAFFPSIHLSGRSFFIVWQGRSGTYTDNLFFIRSFNSGRSWGGRQQITSTEGSSIAPSVLLHRNALYVAYQNNDSKNWSIKLIKGDPNGELWDTSPLQVSQTNVNCFAPVIVPSGNDLMVLWYDAREGKDNVYARKYTVKDDRVGDLRRLSVRNIAAKSPAAVAVGNKVVAMWEEGGVIMGKNSDVHVDPPVVTSSSHPEGLWSKNPVAYIKWKAPSDESGIVAYWTLVTTKPDPRPFVDPPIADTEGNVTQKIIPDLNDGITYFHIRAEDGAGNLSRTVHYKIQVSINPLPLPVVVSPTHPQGQPSQSPSPSFRWAVDDSDRLKGFYYSLSKDYFARPDTFTTDFEVSFKDLPEGRYFFRLAAVDKTNHLSQPSTYDIVVGKAEELDTELLKKIAKEEKYIPEKEKEEAIRMPRRPLPSAFITFPFVTSRPFDKNGFRALIVTRNIAKESILGYSVFIDRTRKDFPPGITTKSDILNVTNLTSGQYNIGVRCKYYTMAGGRKEIRWTGGSVVTFTVNLSDRPSPLERILGSVTDRIRGFASVTTLFFLTVGFSIVLIGYGKRIAFTVNLVQYRMRTAVDRHFRRAEES